MDQQYLNKYFQSVWKPNLDQYNYSGWQLVNRVKKDEWVIDVGCGNNEFKTEIKNLVGIDPATDLADVKTTIEEFRTDHKFDVAFCLGSINFGSEETIKHQISCVDTLLKPTGRIYWRCNPGKQDHDNDECHAINFYPWSETKHYELADLFGYSVKQLEWDNNDRLFAEWIKNI